MPFAKRKTIAGDHESSIHMGIAIIAAIIGALHKQIWHFSAFKLKSPTHFVKTSANEL